MCGFQCEDAVATSQQVGVGLKPGQGSCCTFPLCLRGFTSWVLHLPATVQKHARKVSQKLGILCSYVWVQMVVCLFVALMATDVTPPTPYDS